MKMKVDAADVAKAGIFISALMLFFGFGNYYAIVDLATSETEKQAAPWALLWLVVGVVGLSLLVLSMVQYRKVRRQSGGRLR